MKIANQPNINAEWYYSSQSAPPEVLSQLAPLAPPADLDSQSGKPDKHLHKAHAAAEHRQDFNLKVAVKIFNAQVSISVDDALQTALGTPDDKSAPAADPLKRKETTYRISFDKQIEGYEKMRGKDALPSPEESAGIIVKFATSFFDIFKSRHPEMSDEDAQREYEKMIRSSIKDGVIKALDIIQGLGADDKDTMDRVGKTLDKVEEGLATFFGAQLKKTKGEGTEYKVPADQKISLDNLLHKIEKKKTQVEAV